MKIFTRRNYLQVTAIIAGFGFVYTAFSAPPGSPYNLGETLAPTCAPGDANCTVVVPLQSGANSSATLGIGTASAPDAAIEIDTDTGGFPDGWAENLKLTSQEYPALWLHAESDDEGWIIGADEGDGLWIATSDGTSAGDNLFVIEEGGFVGIGTTDPGELLELAADDDADLDIYSANNTNSDWSDITIYGSRGTLSTPLISQDGDDVGAINIFGHDGAGYEPLASIDFKVSDTPGADDMPGSIIFATTGDGEDFTRDRMVIDEDGVVSINPENLNYSDEEFHIGDEAGGGSSDTAISIENNNSGSTYVYEIHVEDSNEFVIYQNENEDSGNSVLMYNGATQHWGFGTDPTANELQMDSGAHITAGGVFTDASSRAYKTGIESITLEEAKQALALLDPVRFQYKEQLGEEYLGFIAEDVPDLVATADRKGLSSMDIVAVLVKVNQDQQQRIDHLEQELEVLKQIVNNL